MFFRSDNFTTDKNLSDGSAFQANTLRQTIDIVAIHGPGGGNGYKVSFKAFVTSFSDKYSTNFNSEEVYGRMDPVQMYKNTQRSISIAFDVPSSSMAEAQHNLTKCAELAKIQYPVYRHQHDAMSIQSPPLFRLKFGNLIQTSIGTGAGLPGVMNGFTYDVDVEAGFYYEGDTYYPKLVKLSIEFTPLHDHALGFDENGKPFEGAFPFLTQSNIEDEAIAQSVVDENTVAEASLFEDPDEQQARIDKLLQDKGITEAPMGPLR